jgi:hypothetical protein
LELRPFIKTVLIDEVRVMHQSGVPMHTLAAVAHGIEVCGALLDSKPFKAKGLGRTRFQLALTKLFTRNYAMVTTKVDLYGQLRSHMSHSMIPGQLIILADDTRHLHLVDGRLELSLNLIVSDYLLACQQLLTLIESGKLPSKRIAG